MALIPGSVRFTGFIAPSDSTDTYYVLDPIYGKGGYREVSNLVERDAITTERRRQGMMVFVQSDGKFYYLKTGITNADWSEFTSGGLGIDPVTVDHGGTGLIDVDPGLVIFGSTATELDTDAALYYDQSKKQLFSESFGLSTKTLGAITQGTLEYDGASLYFSPTALVRNKIMLIPAAVSSYTVSNDTVSRTINAQDIGLDQLANLVCTLIRDLKDLKVLNVA